MLRCSDPQLVDSAMNVGVRRQVEVIEGLIVFFDGFCFEATRETRKREGEEEKMMKKKKKGNEEERQKKICSFYVRCFKLLNVVTERCCCWCD